MKLFAGTRFPVDEDLQRKVQTRNILERKGFNPKANFHQLAAIIASGSILDELEKISCPALVFHGTEDPLVPASHAEKYAALIPDAKLVWMQGIGHELSHGIMELVLTEIFDNMVRSV